jgi:hypothetical protein
MGAARQEAITGTERDRLKLARVDWVVDAIDSADYVVINILKATLGLVLSETAMLVLYPLAVATTLIRGILGIRQAWLNRDQDNVTFGRQILRAVIYALSAVAVTTVIVGLFVAEALFGGVATFVFLGVIATKTALYLGNMFYFAYLSTQYPDDIDSKRVKDLIKQYSDPLSTISKLKDARDEAILAGNIELERHLEEAITKVTQRETAFAFAIGVVALVCATIASYFVSMLMQSAFVVAGVISGTLSAAYAVYATLEITRDLNEMKPVSPYTAVSAEENPLPPADSTIADNKPESLKNQRDIIIALENANPAADAPISGLASPTVTQRSSSDLSNASNDSLIEAPTPATPFTPLAKQTTGSDVEPYPAVEWTAPSFT